MSDKTLSAKNLLDHFFNEFLRRTGRKMLVNGKRDMALLKKLLEAFGDEPIQIIDDFFDDSWAQETGYSVPLLYGMANAIASRR